MMTETFAGVLGEVVRPFTYVVIEETKVNDWGIAGKPMPDLAWLVDGVWVADASTLVRAALTANE